MQTLQKWLEENEFVMLQNDVDFVTELFGTIEQSGIAVNSDGEQTYFVMPLCIVSNNPTGTRVDHETQFSVRSWTGVVEVRIVDDGIGSEDLFRTIANAQDTEATLVILAD